MSIFGAGRERRYYLAANLPFRMILSVDIDIPFAIRKLPGLIRGESRLPRDRAFNKTSLLDQSDFGRSILARLRRTVELDVSNWTGEGRVRQRPRNNPGHWVIRHIRRRSSRWKYRRHFLATR